MDAELKTRWIKALRSGRYKQGHSYLKLDNSYCCLGVLAQIQRCKWNAEAPIFEGVEQESVAYLAPRFAGGLRRETQMRLAALNDGGKSFKEIADYIEKKIA